MLTLEQQYPSVWPELSALRRQFDGVLLSELFTADPLRAQHYSRSAAGITLDLSKHFINQDLLDCFAKLTACADVEQGLHDLISGASVNNTEQRAALHTALRDPQGPKQDCVQPARAQMRQLVDAVHNGHWRGATGQRITDVVNIGIGGSDLGPKMVCEALADYHTAHVRLHFVSNVDPANLNQVLATTPPASTLFIVASKSFTTLETLQNAQTARRWLLAALPDVDEPSLIASHFIAVSSAVGKAETFGISPANVLPMWDWVGGRYSLWSAIGLPIALAIGNTQFDELLAGAHAMDQHTLTAEPQNNLPLLMACLSFWYQHFWEAGTHAVLPYDHHLRSFTEFLQQLDMESLGKSVTRRGETLAYQTGAVLWGAAGTNGQHSFHQLLHQGTRFTPADFVITLQTRRPEDQAQHRHLVANGLAQSQALLYGRPLKQVRAELMAAGMDEAETEKLAPHKIIPGNRPSSLLLLDYLTPTSLGALIALYEHKVYILSLLWQVNAFDQWGVELGKALSEPIFAALNGESGQFDSATQQAIARYLALR